MNKPRIATLKRHTVTGNIETMGLLRRKIPLYLAVKNLISSSGRKNTVPFLSKIPK